MTDRRARLMLATLGFLRLQASESPGLQTLHHGLDSTRGIGMIECEMAWQGDDTYVLNCFRIPSLP